MLFKFLTCFECCRFYLLHACPLDAIKSYLIYCCRSLTWTKREKKNEMAVFCHRAESASATFASERLGHKYRHKLNLIHKSTNSNLNKVLNLWLFYLLTYNFNKLVNLSELINLWLFHSLTHLFIYLFQACTDSENSRIPDTG